MSRTLFAGVAAFALMMGAAFAQDSYSSQSTTVTHPAAPASDYSKSTTVRSTDAYGNQVERSDSIEKSQAMTPEGDSVTTIRTKSTAGVSSPQPLIAGPPVQSSTTTTTTIHSDE